MFSFLTSRSNLSRRVLMSSWSFCSLTFHSALCTSWFKSFSTSREWRRDSRSNTLSSLRLLAWERQYSRKNKKTALEFLVIPKQIAPQVSTGTLLPCRCCDPLWTRLLLSVIMTKNKCNFLVKDYMSSTSAQTLHKGHYYLKAYQPIMGIICLAREDCGGGIVLCTC